MTDALLDLSLRLEKARLVEDIAYLDRLEAKGREDFNDPQLDLSDIIGIHDAAMTFGVTRKAAYLRARELGILSYQTALLAQGQKQ